MVPLESGPNIPEHPVYVKEISREFFYLGMASRNMAGKKKEKYPGGQNIQNKLESKRIIINQNLQYKNKSYKNTQRIVITYLRS